MIGGIFAILLFLSVIILIMYLSVNIKTKSEREDESRIQGSLEEAYIFDPETNTKITLEEAESGEWEVNEDEFWERPEEDIKKFAFEEQKIEERALNLLRSSRRFLKAEPLLDKEVDVLIDSKMLSQYEDWTYNNIFKFNEGYIITPYILNEHKLLMWLKIFDIGGHYYFTEKTKVEAFFDKIRSDDEIKIKGYECYTFKTSRQLSQIRILMKKIAKFSGLEIEIHNDNLLIRTQKYINKEDVIKFEKIIASLYRDIKPFR